MLATMGIFIIAEVIRYYLVKFELNAMFISFCVGFILFMPLISILLHPLLYFKHSTKQHSPFRIILKNLGLVMVVQCLFFLIWITDAIAIYSIYVDQHSFLAKAFNINNVNNVDLSVPFYWGNLLLAVLFSWLSLVLGVMPCLIAQLNDQGVIKNFSRSFSFAKQYKGVFLLCAITIGLVTMLSLLHFNYLFLLAFPLLFKFVFSFFISRRRQF